MTEFSPLTPAGINAELLPLTKIKFTPALDGAQLPKAELPLAVQEMHPSQRAKLQVIEHLGTHPDLLDQALKVEAAIPVWFGDHVISFRDGKIVIDIQSAWTPPDKQKAADAEVFQKATTYPIEVNWITRTPIDSPPLVQLASTAAERPPRRGPSVRGTIEDVIYKLDRPEGVDIATVRFARRFSSGGIQLVLVTLSAKGENAEAINKWRDDIEKTLQEKNIKAGVLLRVENVRQDSSDRLKPYGDRYGVIRDFKALPTIEEMVLGKPRPPITEADRKPLPELNVRDLTQMPAIAIDPPGIRDPEDIIYEEPLSNGNRMLVVCTSINRRFKPGSPQAEFAELAGESLYGRISSVPLFPAEYSYDEFALLPGKPRYALVAAMEIAPDRTIIKKQLQIAKVMSHRQMSFEEADAIVDGQEDPMREKLLSMRDMAAMLKRRPQETVLWGDFDERNDGMFIVTNCSIASKYIFASEMEKTGRPIIYQVHARYNDERKQEFIKKVREFGLDIGEEQFADPVKFREMIGELGRKGGGELAFAILDTLFERGRFQTSNWGHEYLKLDSYAPLKTRLYGGWFNQQQAQAEFVGEPAATPEQVEHANEVAGRTHRRIDYTTALLRSFEDLYKHKEHQGERYEATVKKVWANEIWISVPDYYRWGSVKFKRDSGDAANFQVGDKVPVTMDGYDIRNGRFRFNIDGE